MKGKSYPHRVSGADDTEAGIGCIMVIAGLFLLGALFYSSFKGNEEQPNPNEQIEREAKEES